MDLLKTAMGALSGGGAEGNGLANGVIALLQDREGGGLEGLLGAFREKGLGEAVASWIGTGANQPIGGKDVLDALGGERIKALAGAAGVPESEAPGLLAGIIPKVVDSLTPEGRLPEGGLLEQGLALLGRRSG